LMERLDKVNAVEQVDEVDPNEEAAEKTA
jgi:hypothetical protein